MAGISDSVDLTGFEQSEPRCKICCSPHRREIDSMLTTGWSQAAVRRHWNAYLRKPMFSANNISVHASQHLNPQDTALWPIRQRCVALLLEQAREGEALTLPLADNIRQLAQILESFGLYGLDNNLVEVEAKDVFRAIKLSEDLNEVAVAGRENAARQQQVAIMDEFKLFIEAVKQVVPTDDHVKILARFEELLSDSGITEELA